MLKILPKQRKWRKKWIFGGFFGFAPTEFFRAFGAFLVGDHLFTGDTLFPGGPGRTGSHESLEQIIDSITTKIYTLGDDLFMIPGHGEHSSLGISKEEYAIFVQKEHPADLSGDVLWTGN